MLSTPFISNALTLTTGTVEDGVNIPYSVDANGYDSTDDVYCLNVDSGNALRFTFGSGDDSRADKVVIKNPPYLFGTSRTSCLKTLFHCEDDVASSQLN